MKFVLIILFVAASYDGGVAIDKVEGFRTMESCQQASANIPREPFRGWDQAVSSYCIEVK